MRAVESEPPETARATWLSRSSSEKSAVMSGGAAGTLGFGLGALPGIDCLRILGTHGRIGSASLLALAQPVERDAELQETVRCATAVAVLLIALQEVRGSALEIA